MKIIPVTVTSVNGKVSSGQVRLQVWTRKESLIRAFKFLGLCWGLSMVSIAIPLVHFFLVPGLFLGGIFGAYIVSCQDRVILGGESTCPECASPLPIARASDEWPLSDLCSNCQNRLTLQKTEQT
jgi:hypothetical protein